MCSPSATTRHKAAARRAEAVAATAAAMEGVARLHQCRRGPVGPPVQPLRTRRLPRQQQLLDQTAAVAAPRQLHHRRVEIPLPCLPQQVPQTLAAQPLGASEPRPPLRPDRMRQQLTGCNRGKRLKPKVRQCVMRKWSVST